MITLLSKPACMQCDATKITFEDSDVTYTEIDMSEDAEALALAKSLGFKQAPVILVHDEAGNLIDKWSGFQPNKISAL